MRAPTITSDHRSSPDWTATTPRLDAGGDPSWIRILFPYSGTPTAAAALDVAADWAHALRAEAWVLYVRPWDTSRGGHYYVETRAEAHAVTQAAVSRLRRRGVTASGVVRDADRARLVDTILAEAEAVDARLIILGTRARRVLSAALVGSTTLAVARRATGPVILVKGTLGRNVGLRLTPFNREDTDGQPTC